MPAGEATNPISESIPPPVHAGESTSPPPSIADFKSTSRSESTPSQRPHDVELLVLLLLLLLLLLLPAIIASPAWPSHKLNPDEPVSTPRGRPIGGVKLSLVVLGTRGDLE